MKNIPILFSSLLLSACFPETVFIQNENVALEKVIQSVEKHKLTLLNKEYLLFIPNDKGDYYEIEVREKHNRKCGGDSQTSPRLFTYEIHKKTREMYIDELIESGLIRNID